MLFVPGGGCMVFLGCRDRKQFAGLPSDRVPSPKSVWRLPYHVIRCLHRDFAADGVRGSVVTIFRSIARIHTWGLRCVLRFNWVKVGA